MESMEDGNRHHTGAGRSYYIRHRGAWGLCGVVTKGLVAVAASFKRGLPHETW